MVKTAKALLVGGAGWVAAYSSDAGKEIWRSEIEGTVESFAVSNGRVYASTHGLSCVAVRLCNPGFAQDQGRVADPNVPGEAEAISVLRPTWFSVPKICPHAPL